MRFAAWYGIVVGALMIIQWAFFLVSRNVPEIKTEPARIAFHLAGEFVASVGLVVGGIALLRSTAWAETVYLVAAGMVMYSEIVSPGYFAQKRQWALAGMFAVLLVLAVASVVLLTRAT